MAALKVWSCFLSAPLLVVMFRIKTSSSLKCMAFLRCSFVRRLSLVAHEGVYVSKELYLRFAMEDFACMGRLRSRRTAHMQVPSRFIHSQIRHHPKHCLLPKSCSSSQHFEGRDLEWTTQPLSWQHLGSHSWESAYRSPVSSFFLLSCTPSKLNLVATRGVINLVAQKTVGWRAGHPVHTHMVLLRSVV
jgi:hypothetical protein